MTDAVYGGIGLFLMTEQVAVSLSIAASGASLVKLLNRRSVPLTLRVGRHFAAPMYRAATSEKRIPPSVRFAPTHRFRQGANASPAEGTFSSRD